MMLVSPRLATYFLFFLKGVLIILMWGT